MVGGTKQAAIWLQIVNHRELSRPDLGREILLQGRFYEAQMDWDMIVGDDLMIETDSGVLPAQASMTLYQDDQLSWLSSPEHHVECRWIQPERNQLEVAALRTEPAGPANQEYGVMPEVASRVVADLGASDPALHVFSSGTCAHLRVCEKYWSAQDSAWKKHWGLHQCLMWIHCPQWDIPRAVAKIRKDHSKAVLVIPLSDSAPSGALHFYDPLGLCGLSLIAMGGDIRHALAGGVGSPAETVRHGVVLARNIHNHEVELGQGLMPSCPSGGRTRAGVHVLFVPRLKTLMVGAESNRMEGYVPSPFPESHDDGIRLYFLGRPRPSLAFCQDSAPEGHRHVPPIVKHLFQHSSNGVVGSVGAQDEPSVRIREVQTHCG